MIFTQEKKSENGDFISIFVKIILNHLMGVHQLLKCLAD